MSIFEFQRKLSRRLLIWSGLSAAASLPLILDTWKPYRDMGGQFLAWGAIDAIIAIAGQRASDKKQAEGADPQQEAKKLRRLLWINTGLDVFYVAGGIHLLQREKGKWRGHGAGIIVQGAFLFFFDLIHAIRVPQLRESKREPQT